MSYTSPRTWITNELVTAALLNTHLRDNLLALWVGAALGDLDYYASATTKARLGIGSAGQKLTVVNGAPAWTDAYGCKVYNTGSQSIPNDTDTDLSTFNGESFDDGGFHAGTNGYLTVPAGLGGIYHICATGYFSPGEVDARLREIGIKINDAVTERASTMNAQNVDSTHCNISILKKLVAGDTVRVTVKQKSGVALNFNYFILTVAKI